MEIEKLNISELIPYSGNAKQHPPEQIEQIKASILDFGFNDPIAVDENNMVIEGHGRLMALKQLGYTEVECIRIEGLNEQQKSAYILVHNQLTMNTGFELDKIEVELDKIRDINMDFYGFKIDTDFSKLDKEIKQIKTDAEEKENARNQTFNKYNMQLFDDTDCDGFYQMPMLYNDGYIPNKLIGFNYAKSSVDKDTGIHFFIDDYQFERCWNNPDEYLPILEEYNCVLTPDFSLYMDMSMPTKVWNIYRSRLLGQYWQRNGLIVIPTISWAERDTFEFCFDGIEEGSIVAISTIGVKREDDAFQVWKDGVDEMIRRIHPQAILCYGGKVDYDFKDNKVIYFENGVTERMKESKKKGRSSHE